MKTILLSLVITSGLYAQITPTPCTPIDGTLNAGPVMAGTGPTDLAALINTCTGNLSSAFASAVNLNTVYSNPAWITALAYGKITVTSGQILTTIGAGAITNSYLATPSLTVNNVTCTLGGTCTVLTGLASISTGTISNSYLTNSSISINGTPISLGGSVTLQPPLGFTPLNAASNLSDVGSAATARTNLGLGTAATQASSAFDAAGAAATAQSASVQKSANLSDLSSAATARTNLGLGTAATQASSAFDTAGAAAAAQAASDPAGTAATAQAAAVALSAQRASNLSDLSNATTARANLGLGGAAVHGASVTINGVTCTLDGTCSITGTIPTVFGRVGAIVATTGDYSAAQISGLGGAATHGATITINGVTCTLDGSCTVAGGGGGTVSSFIGRTGAIVAVAGDYTAAQVTNAVDSTGSYSNPSWLTALAYSKLTGAPTIPTIGGSGILKGSSGNGVAAGFADIFALFAGCSGTMVPGFDGTCHTLAGGATGPGYTATSTTNVTTCTSCSLTFITQAGLAYLPGDRVRVSWQTTPTDYVEGQVTSYSGTTLTIAADHIGGVAGTWAAWNIGIAGDPGSGGGSGVTAAPGANYFPVSTGSGVGAYAWQPVNTIPATGFGLLAENSSGGGMAFATGATLMAELCGTATVSSSPVSLLFAPFTLCGGAVTPAQLGYLDATSSVQTQLNAKTVTTNGALTFLADGGGSAPVAGTVRCSTAAYGGTITGWTILGSASGSAQFDVWVANFGASLPTVTNSIVASAPPALSSAVTATSSTLTGWTTAVTKGQMVCFSVTSASTLTWANLSLAVTRSN
jgi:hypothetical protein